MNIYHHLLMEHYRNPRHYGLIESPMFYAHHTNSACGDSISFSGIIDHEDRISKIGFIATGCVISVATASLLADKACGASLSYVFTLSFADIQQLTGLSLGPVRSFCALLPLEALQRGIAEYQRDGRKNVKSCEGDQRAS